LLFTNCKSVKPNIENSLSIEDKILTMLKGDSILSKHFTGFKLYDLSENKDLISHNEDFLFTPASNIKLLTYLTCLNVLGDSISSFKYNFTNDTLLIIPNGDPSFLNHEIDTLQRAFEFLKSQGQVIQIYNNSKNNVKPLGPGWAWEDSQYSYQSPMSFFPMYGNRVTFTPSSNFYNINVSPSYFKSRTVLKDTFNKFIKRDDFENVFYVNDKQIPKNYKVTRPFIVSENLTVKLLADTVNQKVEIIENIQTGEWSNYYSIASDSLYKKVLFESDNHVADQLLLMCSNEALGYMNTDSIIQFAVDNFLNLNSTDIRWVDGSGLSRYNLISPKMANIILNKIFKKAGLQKIKTLFPTGRFGDTLPSIFSNEKNWIYAKTGTLSNNFCISGYLITDKNKILSFSFMNNHYVSGKRAVSESMYNILKTIKNNY